MKKYNVTVNGMTYEVVVEEAGEVAASPAPQAAPMAAPAAPKAAPAPAAKPAVSKPAAGAKTVAAPMPGTILKMNVKVGDAVKKNDLVCILVTEGYGGSESPLSRLSRARHSSARAPRRTSSARASRRSARDSTA